MPDTATELICVNTLCKADDEEKYCSACGILDIPRAANVSNVFCKRCGHELVRFEKEIIDRAAIKAMDVPIGEIIDFSKCFNEENN